MNQRLTKNWVREKVLPYRINWPSTPTKKEQQAPSLLTVILWNSLGWARLGRAIQRQSKGPSSGMEVGKIQWLPSSVARMLRAVQEPSGLSPLEWLRGTDVAKNSHHWSRYNCYRWIRIENLVFWEWFVKFSCLESRYSDVSTWIEEKLVFFRYTEEIGQAYSTGV